MANTHKIVLPLLVFAWRTEYSIKVTNIRPLVDPDAVTTFGEPAISGSLG